ncbi:zinc ribbon domain-containing protein [Paenibacillus sp.]|jgi:RNA polymerase subunit RPABC4/transcription elongation factor Spt4|uniref:zinc ribbon domain-containing protein n=1 Tax=Paenibacillus sp. TaxID=58172 RepID=UPI0028319386|nr:zinc ribbon domain-containing protein [Paenibacillus sp.]MDR0269221.1 zinc ribbon domain-containing protein [Paenibacillus sp.]
MNILQRIKDGANRATEKAQGAVEVSKLSGQIAEIEKEMELHFMEMGRFFYDGYREEDMSLAEKEMLKHSKACDGLQQEIDELRRRIAELKNEKLCQCGRTVELDANFCPSCGRNLKGGETPQKRGDSRAAAAAMFHDDDFAETRIYKEPIQEDDDFDFDFDHAFDRKETGASAEHVYEFDNPQDKEWVTSDEEGSLTDEHERRQVEDLERERERQLELDRRIRFWKENNEGGAEAAEAESQRETVKCQICRSDLPKGSKWCPRCGAEQI